MTQPTNSIDSENHKKYKPFLETNDLPKVYKGSKLKKSKRGARFNGKHKD